MDKEKIVWVIILTLVLIFSALIIKYYLDTVLIPNLRSPVNLTNLSTILS
jgi:hypothetical protein